MTNVEELLVKIDATTEGLRRELKQADKHLTKFESAVSNTQKKVDAAFARINRAVGGTLKAVGALVVLKTVGQIGSVLQDVGKQMALLETATGSLDKAKQAFADMQEFAKSTPFALEESINGFAKLKLMGLDPTIESMTSYANTAAATGRTLEQMIDAVTKATVMEFETLKSFGIIARQETDSIRFIFKGVETQVGKSAVEVEKYLRNIGQTDFAGAATKQMEGLEGKFVNLQDAFTRLVMALGEAGLTDILATVADKIVEIVDGIVDIGRASAQLYKNMHGPIAQLNELYERRNELEKEQQQLFAANGGLGRRATEVDELLMKLEDEISTAEYKLQIETEVQEAEEKSTEAKKRAAAATGQLTKEQIKAAEAAAKLKKELDAQLQTFLEFDPATKKANELFDSLEELERIEAAGIGTAQELAEAHRLVWQEFDEVDKAASGTAETIKQETALWATAVDNAVRRIDDIFADMWNGVIDSTESAFDAIKDMFKRLLADLLHAAVTRPIMLQFSTALGLGGAAGTAGAVGAAGAGLMNGGGIAGMATGLATLFGGNSIGTAFAGLGDWAFANGLPVGSLMEAGMLPNWAFGLAGIGGGLLGQKAFGGYGGIGGGLGAAAGLAFGGPIGAILGGVGGGFLGGLFGGGGDTRKSRVGIGNIAPGGSLATLEDQYGVATPFGTVGLMGESRDVSPKREENWRQFLDLLGSMDLTLASIMTETGINAAAGNLAGFRGNFSDLEDLTDEQLAKNVKERMDIILREIEGPAGELLNAFSQAFSGTVEELATGVNAVVMLQKQIDADLFSAYESAVANANKTLLDIYREQTDEVFDLAANLDASAASMQNLANANAERMALELQMLTLLDEAANSIASTLGKTIEMITLDLMDQAGQYDYLSTQAEQLAASLAEMVDPTQIMDTVARIDQLTRQAYGILDEGQREQMGTGFVDFLNDVQVLAEERLEAVRQDVAEQSTQLRDVIQTAMGQAADEFKKAAQMMNQAAGDMMVAARRIPSKIQVEVLASEVNG